MPPEFRKRYRATPAVAKLRNYYRAILDPNRAGSFDPDDVLDLLVGLHLIAHPERGKPNAVRSNDDQ